MASIIDQDPFNEYDANGVTTVYPYTFHLLEAGDLVVTIDLAATTAFTLSGVGNQSGGYVTFTVAPASGTVRLSRKISLSRDTDYQYSGELREATLDRDFNRIWQALQEWRATTGGAIRAPYPIQMAELPGDPADYPGYFLGIDLLGNPTYALAPTGTAADVVTRLASTTSPSDNAGMVWFSQALAYPANTVGAKLKRTYYPEDYGADPAGVTASDTAFAEMLADLPQYGEIILDGNYKLTTDFTITNRSNIGIGGRGRMFLSGAASGAFVIKLVGACDDILFRGFTIVGDNNATYSQTGIGNNSGQTLSRLRTVDLTVKQINVGLSMTGNGGSCDRWFSSGCILSQIRGVSSGQGYGFHIDNATNGTCIGLNVDQAERHSIYHARGSNNKFIAPHITNHRQTVFDGTLRGALIISRSSNVQVIGGEVLDGYDGQLEISQDTSMALDCSNIVVDGLKITNRKNSIAAVTVGEQAVPSGYMARNVRMKLDIVDEHTLVSGTSSISVLNVSGLSMRGTRIKRTGINGTSRLVGLGHGAYISAAGDCTDTVLNGMDFICEGSVLTDTRVIDIDADVCANTSAHTIGPNYYKGAAYEAYPNATITNNSLIVEDSQGTRLGVYTAADTNPSVAGVNVLAVSNAGAVSLTGLANGVINQRVLLRNTGAGTCTLLAANFYTPGAVNLVLGTNDTAICICHATGGAWGIVSTSNN